MSLQISAARRNHDASLQYREEQVHTGTGVTFRPMRYSALTLWFAVANRGVRARPGGVFFFVAEQYIHYKNLNISYHTTNTQIKPETEQHGDTEVRRFGIT